MALKTILLLTTILQQLCSGLPTVTQEQEELNVLVLVPDPQPQLPLSYQPSYSEGPALYIATKLAADIINNSSTILEGYHLNLLRGDSGCNVPFRAVEAFATPLLRSAHDADTIAGIVGPICSRSTLLVSALSRRDEISLINIHLAATDLLNDRKKFPYAFSLFDSVELLSNAMVFVMERANWTQVAVFYDTSRTYFAALKDALEPMLSKNDTLVIGISAIDVSPIHSIRNKYRVVYLLVGEDLLNRILCIAHVHGYSSPTYQYVLGLDQHLEAIDSIAFESFNCTRDQMRTILNGSIHIDYQVERSDNNTVTASGISLNTFHEMYRQRLNRSDVDINAVFFDAIWSFALAMDAAMNFTNLSSYSFGQKKVTNLIREQLFTLDFEGLSGKIQFNRTTGRVRQNASIFLINEGSVTKLGYYNRENNQLSAGEIYIRDVFNIVIKTVPKPLVYVILVVTTLSFLLTLLLNILTCAYRNTPSVKASSVRLGQVVFVGCYINALSLILALLTYGFSDEINELVLCNFQHLLDFTVSVGLTVIFGAICVRLWKLYRIFSHYRDPGNVSDCFLLLIVVATVAIDLVFTLPAFFLDKYEPIVRDLDISNSDGTQYVVLMCERNYFYPWLVGGLLVSAILLTCIIILAILTRKIPVKNFKTNLVLYLCYILVGIIPFLLGLYYVFSSLKGYTSLVLRFCTVCAFLLCHILLPCAFLILPPLFPVISISLFIQMPS